MHTSHERNGVDPQQKQLKSPLIRQGKDDARSRLATFYSFPYTSSVSPTALAEAGFHYEGNKDEVVCHKCKLKYGNWQKGDDPLSKHLEQSPECPFFKNSTGCDNDEVTYSVFKPESEVFNQREKNVDSISASFGSLNVNRIDTANQNGSVISNTAETLGTAEGSVTSSISRGNIEDNQFLTKNVSDGRTPTKVTASSAQRHESLDRRNNSGNDQGVWRNVPDTEHISSTNNWESRSVNISERELELEAVSPKYPYYAIFSTRLRSYEHWPRHKRQRPEDMAKAGLFYEGEEDYVRCFHCAGGLREWEPEDDPFFEHARWFPFCQFMRLVKGDQFVMGVQSGRKQLGENQEPATSSKFDGPDLRSHPAVLSLYDFGYSTAIINKALDIFGKKKDNSTLTAHHLLQIVFDIEEHEKEANGTSEEIIAEHSTGKEAESAELHSEKEVTCEEIKTSTADFKTESDLEMLREENRELRDQKTCKVCLDEEASVVFLPCGHLVTCPMCASALRKCPVCRTYIRGTVKAFIS